MDRRINTMPRGGGQSAEPIQRPPISRTANPRESFPGRLVVPSISSQLDIPSVNVIPPPAPVHSTPATRTFDRNNRSSVYTNYYVPTHQARHFSISSSTTHYTQRTQSTLHVIPTRTHSTSKHHRRGQASYSSTTAGLGTQTQSSSAPIQFFKRGLRRGSNTGGDKHDIDPDAYEELESQATEPGAGFQYAATPAVTNSLNADGIRQDPLVPTLAPAVRSRAGLSPSPVSGFGEKRCITISFVGSVKLFEEFAKKLKALFRGGRKGGAWKTSLKRKGSRGQTSRVEMGECYHFTDRGDPHHKHKPSSGSSHGKNEDILSWDQGEIILRIKNNGTGSCVFKVTPAPGNPQELIETPLPMSYLKSQLFVHSRNLVRSLEDWNRHFQNPPPHWVINFVPNAYLRRGLHLAEEVAQYFRTHGLNIGSNAGGGVQQVQWKIEYEAIGHKACLVDEHPKSHVNGGSQPGQNSTLKVAWDNGGRERHPSRCWERKEGWDGCRGLVVGIAL